MRDARVSDGLLSACQTRELLALVREAKRAPTPDVVARNMTAIFHASYVRSLNTIDLLQSMSVLETRHGGLMISKCIATSNSCIEEHIALEVANELIRRVEEKSAWACLRFVAEEGKLRINSMILPSTSDGFGIWIIGFGVASRTSLSDRSWEIVDHHQDLFLKALAQLNSKIPRRSKSSEKLKAELERQSQLGEEAELWVVQYEERRLLSHRLREQIVRISTEDVSAGFDILSFANEHSLRHDRFIEVKSHGVDKRFFWSRNEIQTALEFGDSYCLYLVDRTQFKTDGYEPHIITGPTPELFEIDGSGWTVSASSFEFSYQGS